MFPLWFSREKEEAEQPGGQSSSHFPTVALFVERKVGCEKAETSKLSGMVLKGWQWFAFVDLQG